MRSVFFLTLSAIACLAAAAKENPFNIPSDGYSFTAGEPTTLTWDPTTDGTVSLKLQWGSAAFTSSTGTTIVSGISNSGKYTWSVPDDITDHSDYTVQIISDSDANDSNYLPRFSVEGAEAATSTSSSTSTETETETETSTSTTETPSSTTETTMTTSTTSTTTADDDSSSSPTPTSTSSSSETPASTSSESTTSTDSTESPTDSPTSVPSVNSEDGDNAGMATRVSGSFLALALAVAALV